MLRTSFHEHSTAIENLRVTATTLDAETLAENLKKKETSLEEIGGERVGKQKEETLSYRFSSYRGENHVSLDMIKLN